MGSPTQFIKTNVPATSLVEVRIMDGSEPETRTFYTTVADLLNGGQGASHYVVAAGEFTTAGGDAAEQATVSGVVATDIVVASILDNGTNNVTLLQSAAGAGVIDFTMSADPSTDAIISYAVYRAVS